MNTVSDRIISHRCSDYEAISKNKKLRNQPLKINKAYLFLIFACLLLFSGCKTNCLETNTLKETCESDLIKVLTYNIHAAKGMDGKIDIKRIADVINKASPDIVALQEVDQNTVRSGYVDQPKELAKLTNMNLVYGPAIDYQGGKYGNALLTKYKIVRSNIIPLPGKEKRSIIEVTLDLPKAKKINVLITHLDYFDKESRQLSANIINTLIAADCSKPTILAGDLNATIDSKTMNILMKNWKNTTPKNGLKTFSTIDPKEQIDYILYRPEYDWKVVKTEVIDERIASDHFPLLVILKMIE